MRLVPRTTPLVIRRRRGSSSLRAETSCPSVRMVFHGRTRSSSMRSTSRPDTRIDRRTTGAVRALSRRLAPGKKVWCPPRGRYLRRTSLARAATSVLIVCHDGPTSRSSNGGPAGSKRGGALGARSRSAHTSLLGRPLQRPTAAEWTRRMRVNRAATSCRRRFARRSKAGVANPQPHQTLNPAQLWADLLSSMPLCFNLFGELDSDHTRLTDVIDTLWPDHQGDADQMRFEWSPGRRDPLYLNNRSAFDAAIVLELPDAHRGVIGIETKYHEDIRRERAPHPTSRLPRYREVTERSAIFGSGWEAKLVGTDLQQFWLDHLLVLSMLQHPDAGWS